MSITATDLAEALRAGLSRKELAERIGVHPSTVARAEYRTGVSLTGQHRGLRATLARLQSLADNGMSMREAAKAMGLSYNTVRNYATLYELRFTKWHRKGDTP